MTGYLYAKKVQTWQRHPEEMMHCVLYIMLIGAYTNRPTFLIFKAILDSIDVKPKQTRENT